MHKYLVHRSRQLKANRFLNSFSLSFAVQKLNACDDPQAYRATNSMCYACIKWLPWAAPQIVALPSILAGYEASGKPVD